ncbi:MAG: bifunctional phosphoribosylaminoimidazolecarboxamide formyltransferase/IMP cyclohydrolase [Alphaproteobacteria bacterium]|nr:bifunctional phosphoribosylaminoimidazolecarboxamide formyltransferase/IMP cyclohydrolase [Alphaproteobacteria bacterium]
MYTHRVTIKRALISVADKTGLPPLLKALAEQQVQIISSGGTARYIADLGTPVTEVSELTNFPEILEGRVKTLHPCIHGGILAKRDSRKHVSTLEIHDIPQIDLVIVNLYPFHRFETSENIERTIENIDIGGVALLRAAAKNHAWTTVLSDPCQYRSLIDDLQIGHGSVSAVLRLRNACEAFAHTAEYDVMIANWFARQQANNQQYEPAQRAEEIVRRDHLLVAAQSLGELRYGENPHQTSTVFARHAHDGETVRYLLAEGLKQGKPLSHNNLVDACAAYDSLMDFFPTLAAGVNGEVPDEGDGDGRFTTASHAYLHAGLGLESSDAKDRPRYYRKLCGPTVAIIKHATPCGIAIGDTPLDAFQRALKGDALSAFGGVVAFNRRITKEIAEVLCQTFFEIVIAPNINDDALDVFEEKRPNLRVIELVLQQQSTDLIPLFDGFLSQTKDRFQTPAREWHHVAGPQGDQGVLNELKFAWQACRSVRSNAIVVAKEMMTLGLGGGQTSRVDAAHVAVMKAQRSNHDCRQAVAASDAFFPFPDALEVLIEAGVTAVVHPGGGKNDSMVHEVAQKAGVTVYTTGERHFRH